MSRSISVWIFFVAFPCWGLPLTAAAQNCGCEAQAHCQTVVQHIHKYRHHHCAPPCGVVVPSMAMMPVMAAPMQYAPVAAAPMQYAPIQYAPAQYAPVAAAPAPQYAPPAAVTYQVQAAPAMQFALAPAQAPAAPQYALVQVKPSDSAAAPRAPGNDQDACKALLEMLRQNGSAAPASAPSAAPAGSGDLEGRVSALEVKVKTLQDDVAAWNSTSKELRELLQSLKK